MSVRVDTNGFGRIGRLALRAAWEWPDLEPEKHHLLTAASCMTNCPAPVIKVIHEGMGVRHGMITTVRDMTNTQTIVDGPHKDLRRTRSASLSEPPLVSIDFKDDPRSAIVDVSSTMVTDDTQVKILAWYDNEWGYADRLAELARKVALSLH